MTEDIHPSSASSSEFKTILDKFDKNQPSGTSNELAEESEEYLSLSCSLMGDCTQRKAPACGTSTAQYSEKLKNVPVNSKPDSHLKVRKSHLELCM